MCEYTLTFFNEGQVGLRILNNVLGYILWVYISLMMLYEFKQIKTNRFPPVSSRYSITVHYPENSHKLVID